MPERRKARGTKRGPPRRRTPRKGATPAPGPDGPSLPEAILEPVAHHGEVRAKVPTETGGGFHRVTLRLPAITGPLTRVACVLAVFDRNWVDTLESGFPVDPERFASDIVREAPAHLLDWDGAAAKCDCGDGSGRCPHARAAIAQLRKQIAWSDLLRLRLHDFDLKMWLAEPTTREACAAPRRLERCWVTGENKWEPKPLGADGPPPGIADLREDYVTELHTCLPWEDLAGFLIRGTELVSEWAGNLGDGSRAGAEVLRKAGPLAVTLRGDCSIRSLRAGAEEAGEGEGRIAPGRLEAALAEMLARVRTADIDTLGEPDRYWARLFRHVAELARKFAVIPEIVDCGKTVGHRIAWRPATSRQDVIWEAHQRFVDACPPGLLRMARDVPGEGPLRASAEMQVRHATDVLFRGITELALRAAGEDFRRAFHDAPGIASAFFGRGPSGEAPGDGEEWRRMQAWLRRLSALPDRPRTFLGLKPSEKDKDKVSVTAHFHDMNGEVAPIGELLDSDATPWLVHTHSELGRILGVDLAGRDDWSGVGFDLPLWKFSDFERFTCDDLSQVDVKFSIAAELYDPPALWLGYMVRLLKGTREHGFDLTKRLAIEPTAMVDRRRVDFGRAVRQVEKLSAMLDSALPAERSRMSDHLARVDGRFTTVGKEARFAARVMEPSILEEWKSASPASELLLLLEAALTRTHGLCEARVDMDANDLLAQVLSPGKPPRMPKGLGARLLPHQREGFGWLAHNADIGIGSILADEEGLGREEQAIALVLHRTERDPSHKTLLLVSDFGGADWPGKLRKLAPTLSVQEYHGTGRVLDTGAHDVTLCTHEAARLESGEIGSRDWGLMVLDDVTYAHDPYNVFPRRARECSAQARIVLASYPLEADLQAFGLMLDLANPGLFEAPKGPLRVTWRADRYLEHRGREAFLKIIRPFYLRRIMKDGQVIRESLPARF